jgi:hypothetical protein
MSPERPNGSLRSNFPAPGRGRESPEFGADPPIEGGNYTNTSNWS